MGSSNAPVAAVIPVAIIMIYVILVLILFYINTRTKYDDELTKQKKLFNKMLVAQIIGAILGELFAISINGPANHNSLRFGIPFMLIEKILCLHFASGGHSEENEEENEEKIKTQKINMIKCITIIGTIAMGIIIFSTGGISSSSNIIKSI